MEQDRAQQKTETDEALSDRQKAAVQLFKDGYNCAQSVFAAYADLYGIDRETALRLSASFGAGMGRMRKVCGCFSAIAMLEGMESGSTVGADQQQKMNNYAKVQRLAAIFAEREGGSIICAELLGLDKKPDAGMLAPKPAARTAAYYRKRPCPHIVADAGRIIEEQVLNGGQYEK
jgi:C_GCAxxG_C_C family probable redox protein